MRGSPSGRNETRENGTQRVRWSEPRLVCDFCAGALPAPARTGRPRRWCSDRCRLAGFQRAQRQRLNV